MYRSRARSWRVPRPVSCENATVKAPSAASGDWKRGRRSNFAPSARTTACSSAGVSGGRRTRPVTQLAFASSESGRSEEHTSELQSHSDLVCRLLLEKKKNNKQ